MKTLFELKNASPTLLRSLSALHHELSKVMSEWGSGWLQGFSFHQDTFENKTLPLLVDIIDEPQYFKIEA